MTTKKDSKEIASEDFIKDDYQVVLDDRGFYKIADKWFVKLRRINVKEMISLWSIISSVFGNLSTLGVDLNDPRSWLIMFATALPIVPDKFFQFLSQITELQIDETVKTSEIRRVESEYKEYLKKDLKLEELMDVLNIIYQQEKDRFEDLVKKAQGLFSPLIKKMANKK